MSGTELALKVGSSTGAISPDDRVLIERTRKANKVLSMFVFALQECNDISANSQTDIADMLTALADSVRRRATPFLTSPPAKRVQAGTENTVKEQPMTVQSYSVYGVPCGECSLPAHHIEVYPNGVRTAHVDTKKRPCDSLRPAPKPPDRRGSEPQPPTVLALAPAPVRHPAASVGSPM